MFFFLGSPLSAPSVWNISKFRIRIKCTAYHNFCIGYAIELMIILQGLESIVTS